MLFLLGDCLEVMRQIPDNSVDAVVCDLPYGTTQNSWDAVIPFDPLWREWHRVCKEDAVIVSTAAQPFTSVLVLSNLREFKYTWTWDKVNRPTGHLNAKRQPLRDTEDVVVFCRGVGTYNPQMTVGKPYRATGSKKSTNYGSQKPGVTICTGERYPRNLLPIPADERGTEGRIHPTQKPVALMEYLIRTYTNPGQVVLDNCMGSGTTGVACVRTDREFIGIEKDPVEFRKAEDRIAFEALKKISEQCILTLDSSKQVAA